MSKILRIDSTGGASGDMLLGALHDLGVPLESIQEGLSSLSVDPFFLTVEPKNERGILCQCLTVHVGSEEQAHEHRHDHGRNQDHERGHHHEHGAHRHLPDIEAILDSGTLPDRVREKAREVFYRLADAEASVHGIPREQVHFHEVGAMDSIVDIIGTCWALDFLGVESIECASLPVGQGSFQCQHGIYPLPAPATLALLKGFPTVQTDEPFELVTPTGAALITSWLSGENTPSAWVAEKVGYGAGHRSLNHRPNVLRATLGYRVNADPVTPDAVVVMECNLDDTSPEWLGALLPRLMEAGALDAHYTPCFMKKNRPGYLLRVLSDEENRAQLEKLIFEETMTLGIRRYPAERSVLARTVSEVQTSYGPVRIKFSLSGDGSHKVKPEFDDCEALARQHGVSVRCVYDAALRGFGDTGQEAPDA